MGLFDRFKKEENKPNTEPNKLLAYLIFAEIKEGKSITEGELLKIIDLIPKEEGLSDAEVAESIKPAMNEYMSIASVKEKTEILILNHIHMSR